MEFGGFKHLVIEQDGAALADDEMVLGTAVGWLGRQVRQDPVK
jgi:hypothetical protein